MKEKIEVWRIKFITGFFIFLFLLVSARLFKLQVLDQDYYTSIAEGQYIQSKELPAKRGSIFFKNRYGEEVLVAKDEILYDVYVILPSLSAQGEDVRKKEGEKLLTIQVKNEDGSFSNLISFEKDEDVLKEKDQKKREELIKKKKEKFLKDFSETTQTYFFLGYRISKDEFKKFEDAKIFENNAYRYLFSSGRIYPKGSIGSHVLGFLNANREGNYGVEGFANEILKESKGIIKGEFDKFGRMFAFGKKDKLSAENGTDLYLTIDVGLQREIEKILKNGVERYKAKSGSVVVVNPETGEILSMASYPNFDPNFFFDVSDAEQFNNKNISDQFETGSTMKPIFMASALDAGVVKENSKVYDKTGVLEYDIVSGEKKVGGDLKIRNALNARFPVQTMTEILQNSSNIGMALISEKLGSDKAYEYLTNFGFGKKTGIELSNETSGTIKPHNTSRKWLEVDLATSAFGQGFSVSSIQMAMAGSVLANGGNLLSPKIIDKTIDEKDGEKNMPSNFVRQVISKETSRIISTMLVSSVDKGYAKKGAVAGYAIAGKTGTGEIVDPNTGFYYRNGPFNNTFLGYGPVYPDKPSPILIFVRLEEPEVNGSKFVFAESTAAPLFSEMMKFALEYFQIPKNR